MIHSEKIRIYFMELRNLLSKVFKIVFPFVDFVYLLQQEEYSLQRVTFWLPRFFFRRNIQQRGRIVFTQRVNVTLSISILLFVFTIVLGMGTNFRFLGLVLACMCI